MICGGVDREGGGGGGGGGGEQTIIETVTRHIFSSIDGTTHLSKVEYVIVMCSYTATNTVQYIVVRIVVVPLCMYTYVRCFLKKYISLFHLKLNEELNE